MGSLLVVYCRLDIAVCRIVDDIYSCMYMDMFLIPRFLGVVFDGTGRTEKAYLGPGRCRNDRLSGSYIGKTTMYYV
jgi:hypothetical protein